MARVSSPIPGISPGSDAVRRDPSTVSRSALLRLIAPAAELCAAVDGVNSGPAARAEGIVRAHQEADLELLTLLRPKSCRVGNRIVLLAHVQGSTSLYALGLRTDDGLAATGFGAAPLEALAQAERTAEAYRAALAVPRLTVPMLGLRRELVRLGVAPRETAR